MVPSLMLEDDSAVGRAEEAGQRPEARNRPAGDPQSVPERLRHELGPMPARSARTWRDL